MNDSNAVNGEAKYCDFMIPASMTIEFVEAIKKVGFNAYLKICQNLSALNSKTLFLFF